MDWNCREKGYKIVMHGSIVVIELSLVSLLADIKLQSELGWIDSQLSRMANNNGDLTVIEVKQTSHEASLQKGVAGVS